MSFDGSQHSEMLGPLLIDDTVKNIPLFGVDKPPVETIVSQVLQSSTPETDPIVDLEAKDQPPLSFREATTMAGKLVDLRKRAELSGHLLEATSKNAGLTSNRQLHENLLIRSLCITGFSKHEQSILDHVMLLRSKEQYLFDYSTDIDIVADDPWLKDLWLWVASMYFGCLSFILPRQG
jgi:WD repeat-containing protein mio